MKALSLVLTLTLFGIAPFQCSKPDENRQVEDSPAEALWKLSERFRKGGDDDARRLTLETLIEEYPRSREAERARMALDGRDVSDPEPSSGDEAAP